MEPLLKLNILLVEDVRSDAELVERELERAKLACVTRRVETREEFLRELASSIPDIILADYSLPQFSALDALQLLKEQRSNVPQAVIPQRHGLSPSMPLEVLNLPLMLLRLLA